MKLKELIGLIEHAVPLDWALPKDPVGLHVGDPDQEVKRVYVGLEVSSDFLKKAIRNKADMLLVHHPLIFQPLKRLVENDPVQRLIREIVKHDLALYAAHTNLDLHPEGMAKIWAQKLGCSTMHPLANKPQGRQLKITTYVPEDHLHSIRDALGKAGAGVIGEYDQCSFSVQGEGTFRGSEHSNPFIGNAGVFEKAAEIRLEMLLPERAKWSVVKALYAAHPYDEPAYELYILDEFRDLNQAVWIAQFDKKLSWDDFINRVSHSIPNSEFISEMRPDKRKRIQQIAISTGSGSSLVSLAANLGVDAYLTGEVGYHQLWEANESGLNTVVVGHGQSESFFAETIIPIVDKFTENITWIGES